MALEDQLSALAVALGADVGELTTLVQTFSGGGTPTDPGDGGSSGGTGTPGIAKTQDLGTVTTANKQLPAVTGETWYECLITQSTTFTMPAPVPGVRICLAVQQDGTGQREIDFAIGRWATVIPDPAPANEFTYFRFECNSKDEWVGWWV